MKEKNQAKIPATTQRARKRVRDAIGLLEKIGPPMSCNQAGHLAAARATLEALLDDMTANPKLMPKPNKKATIRFNQEKAGYRDR